MADKWVEGRPRILIVDDDAGARESLELIMEDHFDCLSAEDGTRACELIRKSAFDLVLLDITMPKMSGIETLKHIKILDPSIEVVMVSAVDRAGEAAASIKAGAFDYVTKPFEPDHILQTIQAALEHRYTCAQGEPAAWSWGEDRFSAGDVTIMSASKKMQAIFRLVEKVACTNSNVLITGESGTGKELVARAVHAAGPRAQRPFVAVNCAAIPPELMESEFFGHEKGSFTSAHARSIGKLEHASGGTIFFDEIPSLKLELQAKLLRVLQERSFTRVGGHNLIKVDVRVIAATNVRLDRLVKDSLFRNDLYFRLNVIPIVVPPLRERTGDIPLLSNYFLGQYNRQLSKRIRSISPAAMEILKAYPWPGNVRELENMIERLVVLGSDDRVIDEWDIPFDQLIRGDATELLTEVANPREQGLMEARNIFEREYILRALNRHGWNQTDVARELKIHRNTLAKRMRDLNLRGELYESTTAS
ncbi:MAG: sigma-54-dependent transcriptional regulator [Syntrophobacteraceae bacterium]